MVTHTSRYGPKLFVAYFVIKKFMEYISKHDFIPFGIYRIILAVVVFMYFGIIK